MHWRLVLLVNELNLLFCNFHNFHCRVSTRTDMHYSTFAVPCTMLAHPTMCRKSKFQYIVTILPGLGVVSIDLFVIFLQFTFIWSTQQLDPHQRILGPVHLNCYELMFSLPRQHVPRSDVELVSPAVPKYESIPQFTRNSHPPFPLKSPSPLPTHSLTHTHRDANTSAPYPPCHPRPTTRCTCHKFSASTSHHHKTQH